MAYDTILFDKRDGTATVTLNRPERLNAMTWRMIEELLDAIEDCRHDDTVRVLVFTGAGRAFSSGDDVVGGMGARTRGGDRYESELATFLNELAHGPTLTYAAWKLTVNRAVLSELDSYTDYERQLANRVRETQDHAEGRASFREKRAPEYLGR